MVNGVNSCHTRFWKKFKAIAAYGDIFPRNYHLDTKPPYLELAFRSGDKHNNVPQPMIIGPDNKPYPKSHFLINLPTEVNPQIDKEGHLLPGSRAFWFSFTKVKGMKFWSTNSKYPNGACHPLTLENLCIQLGNTSYRFFKFWEIGTEVGYSLQKKSDDKVVEPLQFYFQPSVKGNLLIPYRWDVRKNDP